MAALIAGAIRPSGTDVDALGVTLHENSKNKAVLFYDTEQSEVQLYKNISNLLRRCGREVMPEWFKAYCLTGMSRKERLLSIIQSLDKYLSLIHISCDISNRTSIPRYFGIVATCVC